MPQFTPDDLAAIRAAFADPKMGLSLGPDASCAPGDLVRCYVEKELQLVAGIYWGKLPLKIDTKLLDDAQKALDKYNELGSPGRYLVTRGWNLLNEVTLFEALLGSTESTGPLIPIVVSSVAYIRPEPKWPMTPCPLELARRVPDVSDPSKLAKMETVLYMGDQGFLKVLGCNDIQAQHLIVSPAPAFRDRAERLTFLKIALSSSDLDSKLVWLSDEDFKKAIFDVPEGMLTDSFKKFYGAAAGSKGEDARAVLLAQANQEYIVFQLGFLIKKVLRARFGGILHILDLEEFHSLLFWVNLARGAVAGDLGTKYNNLFGPGEWAKDVAALRGLGNAGKCRYLPSYLGDVCDGKTSFTMRVAYLMGIVTQLIPEAADRAGITDDILDEIGASPDLCKEAISFFSADKSSKRDRSWDDAVLSALKEEWAYRILLPVAAYVEEIRIRMGNGPIENQTKASNGLFALTKSIHPGLSWDGKNKGLPMTAWLSSWGWPDGPTFDDLNRIATALVSYKNLPSPDSSGPSKKAPVPYPAAVAVERYFTDGTAPEAQVGSALSQLLKDKLPVPTKGQAPSNDYSYLRARLSSNPWGESTRVGAALRIIEDLKNSPKNQDPKVARERAVATFLNVYTCSPDIVAFQRQISNGVQENDVAKRAWTLGATMLAAKVGVPGVFPLAEGIKGLTFLVPYLVSDLCETDPKKKVLAVDEAVRAACTSDSDSADFDLIVSVTELRNAFGVAEPPGNDVRDALIKGSKLKNILEGMSPPDRLLAIYAVAQRDDPTMARDLAKSLTTPSSTLSSILSSYADELADWILREFAKGTREISLDYMKTCAQTRVVPRSWDSNAKSYAAKLVEAVKGLDLSAFFVPNGVTLDPKWEAWLREFGTGHFIELRATLFRRFGEALWDGVSTQMKMGKALTPSLAKNVSRSVTLRVTAGLMQQQYLNTSFFTSFAATTRCFDNLSSTLLLAKEIAAGSRQEDLKQAIAQFEGKIDALKTYQATLANLQDEARAKTITVAVFLMNVALIASGAGFGIGAAGALTQLIWVLSTGVGKTLITGALKTYLGRTGQSTKWDLAKGVVSNVAVSFVDFVYLSEINWIIENRTFLEAKAPQELTADIFLTNTKIVCRSVIAGTQQALLEKVIDRVLWIGQEGAAAPADPWASPKSTWDELKEQLKGSVRLLTALASEWTKEFTASLFYLAAKRLDPNLGRPEEPKPNPGKNEIVLPRWDTDFLQDLDSLHAYLPPLDSANPEPDPSISDEVFQSVYLEVTRSAIDNIVGKRADAILVLMGCQNEATENASVLTKLANAIRDRRRKKL